jgi:outer membrane protein
MKRLIALSLCTCLAALTTPVSSASVTVPQEILFLSLDDTIDICLERNLEIQIARLELSIKETDLPTALARYDTEVEFDIDHEQDEAERASVIQGSKSDTTRYNFAFKRLLRFGTTLAMNFFNQRQATNSSFSSINPSYDTDFEVSLAQPLLKNKGGLIDQSEVAITRIEIEKMDQDTQDKIEEVLFECEKAYWELVRSHEQVDLKTQSLQKAQRFFNINKERLRTGLVEKPDVLAAEANVREKELDVLIAENNFVSRSHDLSLILNLKIEGKIMPTESPEFYEQPAFLDKSVVEAFTNRRDYLNAQKNIKEKNIALSMKKNERWPQLDLTATLTGNGLDPSWEDAFGESFANNNPTYFIGLTGSFSLEGREERAQLDKAEIEKASTILSFQQIELTMIKEVNQAVRDLNLAVVKVEKYTLVKSLQEEKLKEEEKKFSYGRSDSDTLIRFQNDALQASEKSLDAAINYKLASVNLSRIKNTLLSTHERRLHAYR